MKRNLLFLIVLLPLNYAVSGQEADSTQNIVNKEYPEVAGKSDSDSLVINKKLSDTTYYKVGEKSVEIIERNDSTYVKVWKENDQGEQDETDEEDLSHDFDMDFDWDLLGKNENRFRGHWAGFEFGLNNYVDKDFTLQRTTESEFMDLNTNRSWNFNLNFAQYSLPIVTSYFGIVSGMGLEWSNYHFSNPNTIVKNTVNQEIEALDLSVDLIKNRFQTTYLTVPLLVELQFFKGPRKDRMYVAAGLIGGVKLGAHTKYKYSENGNKNKQKDKGDYYLRPLRYAFTGRVGYKLVKLYMNYYPVSLFLEDKGPELYPVAMGFCITF